MLIIHSVVYESLGQNLIREAHREVCRGSYPLWSQQGSRGEYLIEIGGDSAASQVIKLIELIEEFFQLKQATNNYKEESQKAFASSGKILSLVPALIAKLFGRRD